ncbi:hypothetical protein GOBAR_DD01612 [Gossypium barbadense]|nr:hypothetical protein GOBAR_DD01612 [Gossypium barbadense]
MELVDDDDDIATLIAIYFPPKIENPQLVELFAKLANPKPIQVVHPITNGDEGSDNEDQSHLDLEDFSDLDLDEVPEDIDDEGAVEG